MLTYEQAQQALTEIADSVPREIYRELNGGILLLTDTKPHPKSINNNLYILGEYHHDPQGLGRYIIIYFGSFRIVHGNKPKEEQIKRLREILYHELIHHLEGLAGDKTLQRRDHDELDEYMRRFI